MNILILIAILERGVLRNESLEELKQLPLEVGLAAESAAFLLVAADDT